MCLCGGGDVVDFIATLGGFDVLCNMTRHSVGANHLCAHSLFVIIIVIVLFVCIEMAGYTQFLMHSLILRNSRTDNTLTHLITTHTHT